mmetsp:Transcript_2361/g.5593  ORF Transcript_2361/g.5593 Transcript_2361/m.5593 type:complete len:274 (+) Transcript_2361:3-824(+)
MMHETTLSTSQGRAVGPRWTMRGAWLLCFLLPLAAADYQCTCSTQIGIVLAEWECGSWFFDEACGSSECSNDFCMESCFYTCRNSGVKINGILLIVGLVVVFIGIVARCCRWLIVRRRRTAPGREPLIVENRPVTAPSADAGGISQVLLTAAKVGDNDRCIELVRSSADVNITTEKGHTPLHLAALGGHTRVCLSLLDVGGSNVNAVTRKGWTPLHLAAFANKPEVCAVLMDRQARVDLCTDSGQSVHDLAQDKPAVQSVIIGHGSPAASPSL